MASRIVHLLIKNSCARWQLLVNAKKHDKVVINNQLLSNLNAQQRMRCAVHKLFLVKQPLSCKVQCCVENCCRTARWVRSASGQKCICLVHGQDICNGDTVVDIDISMTGRRLPHTAIRWQTSTRYPKDKNCACSSNGYKRSIAKNV